MNANYRTFLLGLILTAGACLATPAWSATGANGRAIGRVLTPAASTTTTTQLYDITDLGTTPYGPGIIPSWLNVNNYACGTDSSGTVGLIYDPTIGDWYNPAPLGESFSTVACINDNGQFVGTLASNNHPAYYSGTSIYDIYNAVSVVSGSPTGVTVGGINNLQQVVGAWIDSSSTRHLFIFDGAIHQVTVPSSLSVNYLGGMTAVNDSGTFVGFAYTTAGYEHAFTGSYQSGLSDIGTLLNAGSTGNTQAIAYGVNNSGQVVGYSYVDSETIHPFIWSPTGTNGVAANPQMVDIGLLPGAVGGIATAINDQGEVTGYDQYTSGWPHVFHWDSKDGLVDVNNGIESPASPPLMAYAWHINNNGTILAQTVTSEGGNTDAYLLTPSTVDQTHTDSFSLKTSNQNLWAADQTATSYSYTKSVGPPDWDFDLFHESDLFDPTLGGWTVDCGFFDVNIPAISLGNFGYQAGIYTNGHAGLNFAATATTGSVAVDYPMAVSLSFPDKDSVDIGDIFPVTATYAVDGAASLVTKGPSASVKLDAVLQENSSCGLDVYAFGVDIFPLDLVPPPLQSVNQDFSILNFSTGSASEDYQFPSASEPIVTGYVKVPKLDSDGGLPSTGGTVLTSSAQDTLATANGHLTDLVSEIFGIPLSGSVKEGPVSGSYNLADVRATADLVAHQDFTFQGAPHVHLDFDQPVYVGTSPSAVINATAPVTSFDFDAILPGSQPNPGSSAQPGTIWIEMPGNATDKSSVRFNVTPTFSLPSDNAHNTFTTNTYVGVNAGIGFVPLDISGSAKVPDWNLGSFHYQPLDYSTSTPVATIPVHSDSFALGGFSNRKESGFNIAGSEYPAPSIKSLAPTTIPIFIAQATNPTATDYAHFHSFLNSAGTPVIVYGRNFTTTTRMFFEIYGQKLPLVTTYLYNTTSLKVIIPNVFRLLPGTGHISCSDTWLDPHSDEISLNSNDKDLSIVYPTPIIGTVGPNIWASDPNFTNVPLTVTDSLTQINAIPSETFIKRIDYYRILSSSYWPRSEAQPMNLYFPGFNFLVDAELPSMLWDELPLASYREPIPSGLLWSILPLAYYDRPRQSSVQIVAAGPGGGASNNVVHVVGGLQPVISSISPDTATPGDPTVRMTIKGPEGNPIPGSPSNTGGNFNGASYVTWNGQTLTPIFISSSELQVDIPATLLAVGGNVNVCVVNPGATNTQGVGSDTSLPMTFTVANPTPTIGAISPSSITTNDPDFAQPANMYGAAMPFNMSVTGTGFVPGSQVTWYNQATSAQTILQTQYVSSTCLDVTVPLFDVSVAGSFLVTVVNPAPILASGSATTSSTVTVADATPGTTSTSLLLGVPTGQTGSTSALNPASIDQCSPQFNLSVQGNGFCNDSVVFFNGSPRATTLISYNELSAVILASDLTQAGTATITVINGGGSASNPLSLPILPSYLLGLTVSTANVTGSKSLTATVTLASGAPTGGTPVTLLLSSPAASFVTSAALLLNADGTATLTIPAGSTSATFTIATIPVVGPTSVVLTASKSGLSQTAIFTVGLPVLATFTLASPTVAVGGTDTATVTLNAPSAAGVTLEASVGSTSSANASVPAFIAFAPSQTSTTFTVTGGTASSTATTINVTLNGTTLSQSVTTVSGTTPTITSLNPTSAYAGGGSATLTVAGTKFVSGAVVHFGSSSLTTTFVSATSLNATITAAERATPGTFSVTVVNPGGVTSNAQTFTVKPRLVGFTVSATKATPGATITGTVTLNFEATSGGVSIPITSSSSTLASVPATVTIPSGATSATFAITIPTAASTGSAPITANGAGATITQTITVVAPISTDADTYAQDGSSSGTNFGTVNPIIVKSASTGTNRISFIQFALSGFTHITSATLTVTGSLSGSSTQATGVYSTSTAWTESGLTWNNKPALGTSLGTITMTGTANTVYTLNVTSYLQSQLAASATAASFGFENSGVNSVTTRIVSKEAGTGQAQLIVTGS